MIWKRPPSPCCVFICRKYGKSFGKDPPLCNSNRTTCLVLLGMENLRANVGLICLAMVVVAVVAMASFCESEFH